MRREPQSASSAGLVSGGLWWDTPGIAVVVVMLVLLPVFLDSLRVTFGVPLMSFLTVSTCLVIWLTRSMAAHRVAVQPSPAYVLLLLMGAAAFLSTTSTMGSPIAKLYRAVSFSYTRLLMVFLLINFLRSRLQARRAMQTVIWLGAGSAVVALWQFWTYEQTGANYSFAQGEDTFRVTLTHTYLRATALASQPNEIGIIMAVGAVWCLHEGFSMEEQRALRRITCALLFLLMLCGVVVTFSRSALLSLLFGVLTSGVVIPLLHGRRAVAAIIGVLGLFALSGMLLLAPTFEEGTEDVLWRLELNRLGARAALEYPVTGVGVDSFPDYDNAYDLAVHNLVIQVAAELGLVGLGLFLVLTGSLLVRLLWAAWTTRDAGRRALLIAVALGFVTKLVSHTSNPILTDLFFWFSVGLGEAAVGAQEAPFAPRPDRRRSLATAGARASGAPGP